MNVVKLEKCINSADRLKGFVSLTNIYIKKSALEDTARLIFKVNKYPIIDIPTLALKDHYYIKIEDEITKAKHLEKRVYPEGMVGVYLPDITNLCLQYEDELSIRVEFKEGEYLKDHLIICEGERIIPQIQ
ncbi:MAG: hypothetical protein PHX21_13010 [bacterium]|nr:hypothetical protein [bacterium]